MAEVGKAEARVVRREARGGARPRGVAGEGGGRREGVRRGGPMPVHAGLGQRVSGQYFMISGQYIMVSGQYIMVSGHNIMVSGQYIIVSGQYIMVSGQDIMVSGQ